MRELRVEDALLYLDQVKVEFGDRPHIYNEFLDIMKTFKTQQIDTPGVIRRVSNLFQGNRKLVLGFNTFLPEGYKIEIPLGGDGPPVAVYRAPGSSVAHVLSSPETAPPASRAAAMPPHAHQAMQSATATANPPARGRPPQQQQGMPSQHPREEMPPYGQKPMVDGGAGGPPRGGPQQQPPAGMPSQGRGQHPVEAQQQPPRGGPDQQQRQQQQQGRPHQLPSSMALPHGGMPQPQPPAKATGRQFPADAPPAPVEFDHAINYVTTIKKRFSSEPETYKRFLEILHTYQQEQRGIKEVLDEVSTLFADHPDLLKEFTYFLPDAVQGQAKAQLDQVAKESEARKRAQAKQAIMHTAQGMQRDAQSQSRVPARELDRNAIAIPFGATQGRSVERERAIAQGAAYGVVTFAPVLPPKRGNLTPHEAALKVGRPVAIPELPILPSTAETSFFQRAKEHLNRKELAADKAPGTKRHTPYTEFIKCLHLFGAGVLNKDELVLLLRGLFMQGHAPKSGINAGGGVMSAAVATDATELLREMEEILVGRGPYADQETTMKDRSKYGAIRPQEFDYSSSETPTPSYRTFPSDYPQTLFISNPGQSDYDASVLNHDIYCVGPEKGSKKRMTRSLEEYDGVRMRHNVCEDTLLSVEDDRFEVDMAIERNSQAMRQIEPYAEEVQALREQEEKDGQPIGRLQYQLNRYAMNSVHINAIGRIYGDQGDEVLQHLCKNPLIVLPIVYQRLKQKDVEWRKAKTELMDKWNAAVEANYEGSFDVLCYTYRRELERTFAPVLLREECKRTKMYSKHPEKIRDHPATLDLTPTFALSSADHGALLYQPFLQVGSKVDVSHKDAFNCVVEQLKTRSSVSDYDRERIGRIWAEFVVPWFGYPAHWVMNEVRASFRGKLTPAVVKSKLRMQVQFDLDSFVAKTNTIILHFCFSVAPGQSVVTIFGAGTIVSFTQGAYGAKYRIKFPFGVAHVGPSAILHAVASKDTPYVRSDGLMVRDESIAEKGGFTGAKLDQKYKLLYSTENGYLFLRLYSLLCSILSATREHCKDFASTEDPSASYHNPVTRDEKETAQKPDYSGVVSALQKVLANKMDFKDFETLGRKVSKEIVYQMAALPKLVERCADALINIVKEDVLLHLFDVCQNQGVDPVAVRKHCLSLAPDAAYRIQYDTTGEKLYFSYVPKSEELLTVPQDDIEEADEEMNGGGTEDAMEEDEEDPVEEFNDSDGPSSKRAKLR